MIRGSVNAKLEASIELTVRGFKTQVLSIRAVVDTGFTDYLTLPTEVIDLLQLPVGGVATATLADGTTAAFDVFVGQVVWDGVARTVPIMRADADALVGMSLMADQELTVTVRDGGTLVLRPAP